MVRIRIATKIFALAVVLLCLTVALSAFGTWQTRLMRAELVRIARRDLPLDQLLQDLDRDGLNRRLDFERWLTLLDRPRPDSVALEKDSADYRAADGQIDADLSGAKSMLDAVPPSDPDAVGLA